MKSGISGTLRWCLTCLWLATLPAWAQVGVVRVVEGDVNVSSGRAECAPRFGLDLNEGDVVRTGEKAWAVLTMMDTTRIIVRPDSVLRIEAYRHTEGGEITQNMARFALMRGAIRVASGQMAGGRNAGFVVRTPDTEMVMRGSDQEVAFVAPKFTAPEAELGTYAKVYTGEAVVKSAGNELTLKAGQVVFAGGKDKAAPRLLAADPHFFYWHSYIDRRVATVMAAQEKEPPPEQQQ